MRHLAAYLLLVSGGTEKPTAEEVSAVLTKSGIEVNEERLTHLIGELADKDVNELIALGKEKLLVGGAPAAGGGGAAAGNSDEA